MRVRLSFDEVALYGEKSGKCRCGKIRKRRQKFCQTLSPFNTKKNGIEKTADEIREELSKEIAKWKKLPITCGECED